MQFRPDVGNGPGLALRRPGAPGPPFPPTNMWAVGYTLNVFGQEGSGVADVKSQGVFSSAHRFIGLFVLST
ncbi:hypothetical protein AXG93_3415s1210 [Marchantia polymorpha subsp. ruderalis]|uniref:Uncharacterized protein n=1 Tax=Marchantia polymorpha subsp. ruderalis TaxID=1480154 RepID=A0A176WG36_MARPO|nr:hypothetical protein AXG93_3415s1210 [Marchantia polymorpha subsp. ruderalis]